MPTTKVQKNGVATKTSDGVDKTVKDVAAKSKEHPKSTEKEAKETKEQIREKAAIAAAAKVRKDFKNLQVKKSGKAMAEVVKEFPEYEAEFKMLRAELLEPAARRDREILEAKAKEGTKGSEPKGRGLIVEMVTLATEAVALKPQWMNAVERCATWLWQVCQTFKIFFARSSDQILVDASATPKDSDIKVNLR